MKLNVLVTYKFICTRSHNNATKTQRH